MKNLILALLMVFSLVVNAQTNVQTFIKGDVLIKYNSRGEDKSAKDVYTVNINVANSALFHGTITDTPLVMGGLMGNTVKQPRSLNYDLACDVVNPKNPTQTKNVGRLYGLVPIDPAGVYHYDTGTLTVSVLPMGNAGGFDSKFGGTAAGKPLVRPANWLDNLKRDAVNITRSVNGKTMTVVLKKYDKMTFNQHVIGTGPVQTYQAVTVNGEMLYDYDKYSWFFNNVTIQYAVNGVVKIDRLTGNIRWVEDKNRKSNGIGEYQFDIRVNEPQPTEGSVFTQTTNDESSFFETDTTVPALTGTMKYKDSLSGETTLSSSVAVELVGNNISKQQTMALCKLIIFSAVVPMNAD